ncbi:MAG: SpoVG family protein [Candidatus Omnitrophota bacterium]
MKITEVRLFPSESRDGKLKAFATMTFDDWFVVRNVKIIQGTSGLFVAMPSRKTMDACVKCGFKNTRGSRYCNQCGKEQPRKEISKEDDNGEKQSGHMDIAHPITPECRLYIQDQVLQAYEKEMKGPGRQRKEVAENPGINPVPEEKIEAEAFVEPVKETAREELVPDKDKDIEL